MPQQQTSLLNLLTTGATELAFNAPTTSPNLQASNLPTLLAQVNTPSIDLNGVTPTIPNLQASNLPTLLAQVKTPNLDLGGVPPPKYIDNQPQ